MGSSKYDRDFLGGLEKPHPEKLFEERKFLGTAVPLPLAEVCRMCGKALV